MTSLTFRRGFDSSWGRWTASSRSTGPQVAIFDPAQGWWGEGGLDHVERFLTNPFSRFRVGVYRDRRGETGAKGLQWRLSGRSLLILVIIALLLGSGGLWLYLHERSSGVAACAAVTRQMVEESIGSKVPPGSPGTPDGGVPGASMCFYGATRGPSVTVFAFRHDADGYFALVRRTDMEEGFTPLDISGPGYSAFMETPAMSPRVPRPTFFLIKHGQYVNVLLNDAPASATRSLAAATARGLP